MAKQHEIQRSCRMDRKRGHRHLVLPELIKRTWDIAVPGKPVVHCSNDPLLGGDPKLMNPEDLLLSSLAACHMLWYLHLASESGVVVQAYRDTPIGVGGDPA